MSKKINKLSIYLNARPVGYLEHKTRQDLRFVYLHDWIERVASFPISRSLPLREEPYDGDNVYAYFDNLLPDGVSIRQRMAARMHAASDQVFDLLTVFGRDCVGALQFLSEDLPPPKLEDAVGTELNDHEIADRLKNLRDVPLAASEEENFRLSIAGAQEKTALLFRDLKWHVPIGATPTTHIFKPQIAELKPGLSFSDSVENEWLCAQIVKAFGLPVANCRIENFENVKVLMVERFDRAWLENRLIRIPQEDMCQALSVPNFEKYESDGGPSIPKIMDLLLESKQPLLDRTNFLKAQVVFYLLAAIDGHAKNFSIHWGVNGFELAPLYDILSAHHMVYTGKFQYEKLKLAMAIGENRHYRIKEIARRHFVQTAKLCRFNTKEMENIIDTVLLSLPRAIDQVKNILPKRFPTDISDSIFNGMVSYQDALKR